MARKSQLSLAMQKAAVKAAMGEGMSLDGVKSKHPELADGVAAIAGEASTPPQAKRSGSGEALSSMTQLPRF